MERRLGFELRPPSNWCPFSPNFLGEAAGVPVWPPSNCCPFSPNFFFFGWEGSPIKRDYRGKIGYPCSILSTVFSLSTKKAGVLPRKTSEPPSLTATSPFLHFLPLFGTNLSGFPSCCLSTSKPSYYLRTCQSPSLALVFGERKLGSPWDVFTFNFHL